MFSYFCNQLDGQANWTMEVMATNTADEELVPKKNSVELCLKILQHLSNVADVAHRCTTTAQWRAKQYTALLQLLHHLEIFNS